MKSRFGGLEKKQTKTHTKPNNPPPPQTNKQKTRKTVLQFTKTLNIVAPPLKCRCREWKNWHNFIFLFPEVNCCCGLEEIGLCPKSMMIYLALNLVNVSRFTLCSWQNQTNSFFLQVFWSLQNIKQLTSGNVAAWGLGPIENPHGGWKGLGFSSQGPSCSIRHLHWDGLRSSQVFNMQIEVKGIHGWICLWQSWRPAVLSIIQEGHENQDWAKTGPMGSPRWGWSGTLRWAATKLTSQKDLAKATPSLDLYW